QVEEHDVGLEPRRLGDRLLPVLRLADHVEALLREQGCERIARQWMVVDDENAFGHLALIGRTSPADKCCVDHPRSQSYRSWLLGEILLVCLLASGTALFTASDSLKSAYELHDARLAFDTAVAVVAAFVCVLTSVRFLVEGRALDLLLAAGFWSIALGTVAFGLVPVLGGGSLPPEAAWPPVGARLLGGGPHRSCAVRRRTTGRSPESTRCRGVRDRAAARHRHGRDPGARCPGHVPCRARAGHVCPSRRDPAHGTLAHRARRVRGSFQTLWP